ncbi:MAG: glycosyltransferase [Flavobacteriaceae bacterium]|nr:glycosyltransferase [Flavobacteriaceae bacterium]
MTPKLSIIIPVYNTANYLVQALSSVLEQTFKNIEIIVINDASTDNSLEIIKSFQKKDERINIIDFKKNKGQGYARNYAIKKAKGEYIVFLDSDDFFEKEALSQININLEQHKEFSVFVWGANQCNSSGKIKKSHIPKKINVKKNETPFNLLLLSRKGFMTLTFAYIIKRDFIEEHHIRFSEGIFFEDIMFTIQLLFHAKKVKVIPKAFYNYRRNKDSVTGRATKQKIDHKFTAFVQIKSFLEKEGVFKQYEAIYLVRFLTMCVYTSFSDYFSLSKNERDAELDTYMKNIRESKLLCKENLELIKNIALSLPKEEKKTKKAYLRAYFGLRAIKNRYNSHQFISRILIKIFRKIKGV